MAKISLLHFYYISAWVLLLTFWLVNPVTWIYGLILGWFFHMIVCSIILHKYYTHKTFKVNKPLQWIFAYLGTLSLNGSVLAWSNMHRLHHATSDRKNDPHDPRKIGFFKSLFVFDPKKYSNNSSLTSNLKNCSDLLKDKPVVFFHKYLVETITLTYLTLLLFAPSLLIILLIGTAVSFIGLFFTTYVYHFKVPFLHYRNHNTVDKSCNNWLTTILFPGESYHNNHHNDPSKFDTAQKKYEFDLSATIIRLLKRD